MADRNTWLQSTYQFTNRFSGGGVMRVYDTLSPKHKADYDWEYEGSNCNSYKKNSSDWEEYNTEFEKLENEYLNAFAWRS